MFFLLPHSVFRDRYMREVIFLVKFEDLFGGQGVAVNIMDQGSFLSHERSYRHFLFNHPSNGFVYPEFMLRLLGHLSYPFARAIRGWASIKGVSKIFRLWASEVPDIYSRVSREIPIEPGRKHSRVGSV